MPEKGFNYRAGRICPTCKKPIRRKHSYSQPGNGKELYHFACRYGGKHDAP